MFVKLNCNWTCTFDGLKFFVPCEFSHPKLASPRPKVSAWPSLSNVMRVWARLGPWGTYQSDAIQWHGGQVANLSGDVPTSTPTRSSYTSAANLGAVMESRVPSAYAAWLPRSPMQWPRVLVQNKQKTEDSSEGTPAVRRRQMSQGRWQRRRRSRAFTSPSASSFIAFVAKNRTSPPA